MRLIVSIALPFEQKERRPFSWQEMGSAPFLRKWWDFFATANWFVVQLRKFRAAWQLLSARLCLPNNFRNFSNSVDDRFGIIAQLSKDYSGIADETPEAI